MSDNPHTEETARMLYDLATQCYAQGDFSGARSFYERALAIQEKLTGTAHPETARYMHGLGNALKELGEYATAQATLERALVIREQMLGAEHPDVAESLHSLGEVIFDRGDFKTGQAFTARALAMRERLLGAEHPDTIESLKNYALQLAYLGHREEAEPLLERGLATCERVFGENHRSTAKLLNALGVFWARNKETHLKARAMHERALAVNQAVKGANHPDTALSLNNLGALLADMGDKEAALGLLERSLALHEQIYGARNPHLPFVLINLADVCSSLHNYTEARSLLERSLIICEPVLGVLHPITLRSLRKLVAVLGNLNRQGDQEALLTGMPLHTCLMALEAAAGTLSEKNRQMPGAHQDPAKAAEQLHKLVLQLENRRARPALSAEEQAQLQQARELAKQADDLAKQGDYASAQARIEEALAIQERILGADDLDHVDLLKKLAWLKEMQGEYTAVLPLIQRVADIHVRVLGPEHPTTLIALGQLMSQTSYEYGLAAAIPIQEQILAANEATLGPDDPMVRSMRSTLERLRESVAKTAPKGEPPSQSRSEKRESALAALPPEREAVLAGIDSIDWHRLSHAYGPADDVPRFLRLLLSDDESVRDDAWEHLYGNIWHQGTVYEATAYAVPFLLKMLTSDGPTEKVGLLAFLTAIAEGSSYLDAHSEFLSDGTFPLRDSLTKQGRDFDAELKKELVHVEAANRAVGEGVPIYLDLLNHADQAIRRQALAVLVTVRGHNTEIVPRLRSLLTATQDTAMRTALVRALHVLMDNSPETLAFFTDLMRGGESGRLTFIAAVALVERARDQAPEDAINTILNALDTANRESSDEEPEPFTAGLEPIWDDGGLRFATSALIHLRLDDAVTLLLRILAMLRDAEDARETAGILLDLIFNEGQVQAKSTALSMQGQGAERHRKVEYWHPRPQPPREAASLTAMQRTVLEAIVAHDPVWEEEHDLLKLYGLPATRDSLRQYLSG